MGRPSPYTEEFKAQAVDLVHNTDRTQADIAARGRSSGPTEIAESCGWGPL